MATSLCSAQDRNFSWANNANGTLGNNTQVNENFPKNYTFVINRQVTGGKEHSVAVDLVREVWAWGFNEQGQVGNGESGVGKKKLTPVQVKKDATTLLRDIEMVACGRRHTLALGTDGRVWAWGDNEYGQLGNQESGVGKISAYATAVKYRNEVTNKYPPLDNVIYIAAGEFFSMALRSDGSVWLWGRNDKGQLAQGDQVDKNYAVQARKGAATFLIASIPNQPTIAAGGQHAMAIEKDTLKVMTWGNNDQGQLGRGAAAQQLFANGAVVKANVTLQPIKTIWAGYKFSAALTYKNKKAPQRIATWGSNEFGQLGNHNVATGANQKSQNWVYVETKKNNKYSDLGEIESIACGEAHAIAKIGQDLWTWGRNNVSQLANNADLDGGPNISKSAVRVMGVGGIGWLTKVKYFGCGWNHNLVFTFNQKVKGQAMLQNFEGENNETVYVELRDPNTLAYVDGGYVTLDDYGYFEFGTWASGLYRIYVRGANWLGRLSSGVYSVSPDPAGIATFSLINGDASPDNEVNLLDFAEVAAAFGSTETSANWSYLADLNRDGEVNLADIAIVSANFGALGDD